MCGISPSKKEGGWGERSVHRFSVKKQNLLFLDTATIATTFPLSWQGTVTDAHRQDLWFCRITRHLNCYSCIFAI